MILLYLSNLLAITLTLGMAIPWASIRLARYRASKLELLVDKPMDHFIAANVTSVNATGEAVGEMFELDMAL